MLWSYTEQRLYIVPKRRYVRSNSTCTDFLRENQGSLLERDVEVLDLAYPIARTRAMEPADLGQSSYST